MSEPNFNMGRVQTTWTNEREWVGGFARKSTIRNNSCLVKWEGGQNCPKFCPRSLYTVPGMDLFNWKCTYFLF